MNLSKYEEIRGSKDWGNKHLRKRVMLLALALALVVSLPIGAMANEINTSKNNDVAVVSDKAPKAAQTVNSQAELKSALTSTTDTNIEIIIGSDFEITEQIDMPTNKTVIIKSDGTVHKLTRAVALKGYMFRVHATSTLNLSDIILDGNKANITDTASTTRGLVNARGGILNLNSGAVLQNNRAVNQHGGALYIDFGTTVSINDGAILRNNEATGSNSRGGAIYVYDGCTLNVNGAEITGNTSADIGGGVYSDGTFNITGGQISGNEAAQNGGGIYNYENLEITGNVEISNNTALKNGGGIYSDAKLILTGSGTISGNTAEIDGGGVYIGGQGNNNSIGNVTITENVAGRDGGGLCSLMNNNSIGTLPVAATIIKDNEAGNDGGGVVIKTLTNFTSGTVISGNKAASDGGGIYCSTADGRLTLNDTTITENEAVNGGGIYYPPSCRTDITDSVISDNIAAESGGGIYSGTYSAPYVIEGTVFSGNVAQGSGDGMGGGAIYKNGHTEVSIVDGEFVDNRATAGFGGAIYFGDLARILELTDTDVKDNFAAVDGGGIFAHNGGIVNSNNIAIDGKSNFSKNEAARNGGGIYVSYNRLDNLNIEADVIFSDNTAKRLAKAIVKADEQLYTDHVKATAWTNTSPITRGYNNYDISYESYTVSYVDKEGNVVKNIGVYGGDAVDSSDVPFVPAAPGYDIDAWDLDATVASNLVDGDNNPMDVIVHPLYTARTDTPYKVEHYKVSSLGTKLDKSESFTGTTDSTANANWNIYPDYNKAPDYSDSKVSGTITGDGSLILKLYYKIKTFTVRFVDDSGNIIKTEVVEYGKDAKLPDNPSKNGYTFKSWSGTYTNVTEDKVVMAIFNKIPKQNNPVNSDDKGIDDGYDDQDQGNERNSDTDEDEDTNNDDGVVLGDGNNPTIIYPNTSTQYDKGSIIRSNSDYESSVTGAERETIEDSQSPFASGSVEQNWSLMSLIMSLIALISALLLVIFAVIKKKFRGGKMARALAVIAGIITPIVWLIVDWPLRNMVWFNQLTILVAIPFIITMIAIIIYNLRKDNVDDEHDEVRYA